MIGFVVPGMTNLKYFFPIVESLNERKIKSVFFVPENCNGKYNSIHKNLPRFLYLCEKNKVEIRKYSESKNFENTLVQIEGRIASWLKK